MTARSNRPSLARIRRHGLALAGAAGLLLSAMAAPSFATNAASDAAAATETAQKIADHFSHVRSMAGEFVQFGPRGEQVGGKFYIERPGRLRFDYDTKTNFEVIADGQSVAVSNPKMKTWNLYPLSKTPLKLLLGDRIDLSGDEVKSVKQDPDATVIQLADRSVFGNSRLTMMFDPKTYELKQWTITDAQGKDTTVMIFNVKEGASVDPSLFKIDYKSIARYNTPRGHR